MKEYTSDDIMVEHPKHYQSKSGLEVIQVIEAFTDGLNGIEATDTANIIKYACRWKDKNGIQDLEKIMWYTQHLIKHLRDKEVSTKINDIKDKETKSYFECPHTNIDIDNFGINTITIDRWDNSCTLVISVDFLYLILNSIIDKDRRSKVIDIIGKSIKMDFEKNLFITTFNSEFIYLIVDSCEFLTPVCDSTRLVNLKFEIDSDDSNFGGNIKVLYKR